MGKQFLKMMRSKHIKNYFKISLIELIILVKLKIKKKENSNLKRALQLSKKMKKLMASSTH